jgi:RND family efflux transporter MFP subunit
MELTKALPGCCVVCMLVLICPPAACADLSSGIVAITTPSADVTLSFTQPGRIAEVYFKEGNMVRTGQVIVQQDDAVEQAQLAQSKAQAEDTTQIQASQASLDQKKLFLKKLQKAAERGAATELEVERAVLDEKIAELSLKVAQFQHEQDQRKYEETKIRVENMELKSPINGRIEKIDVQTGESINALADVARVVRTDPLWTDVPVPLVKASTLKSGQNVTVAFPGPEDALIEGAVIFVAAVADAASSTLRIRVEVPNKSARPAGEHVRVILPPS